MKGLEYLNNNFYKKILIFLSLNSEVGNKLYYN
jgi:hypothetical protein